MTLEFMCLTHTQSVWRFNDKLYLPKNAHIEDRRTLKIIGINVTNKGYYECEGTSLDYEHFWAEGIVKVKGKLLCQLQKCSIG